ncbi:tyrosine-type recombinase/integrase [Halosolutus halophilus]|uniref:tyrosine-type recombinase/integrase n=1 Tax=Halosolutus halophilus TaxID=1552990 RepID=UPI002234FA20|nr:site-specific integrase [Halosolutus halophilus]
MQSVAGNEAAQVQAEYDDFYDWMRREGKKPREGEPLQQSTAKNYVQRLDQAHRHLIHVFNPEDKATIRPGHAEEYLKLLSDDEIKKDDGDEYGNSAKRKLEETLLKYFQWRFYEGSLEDEWEKPINFSDGKGEEAYRFTYTELGQLLEATASYGALPSYDDLSETERDEYRAIIAQRLGIPKDELTREDWLRADYTTKNRSLVFVGHDAGLTPKEVANAERSWYDPKRNVLKIPTEKACKQREKEEVALSDASAEELERWFELRQRLSVYDGTEKLWLNLNGNPYTSGSLCRLLKQLCEEAGIETEGKAIKWYSLRYTMGRNVTEEGELSEANDQLRHSTRKATKRYDKTPVEKLQKRVDMTHQKAAAAAADPDYDPFDESIDHGQTTTQHEPVDITAKVAADPVTKTSGGNIHADVVIPDTTEARAKLAQRILSEDAE